MTAEFALRRSADGAVYDGPHGPITVVSASALRTPHGPATIDWARDMPDDLLLEGDGLAVAIAGAASGRLRRHGRALHMAGEDGETLAVVRPKRFGRLRMERPDGTELATWKDSRGKVTTSATFADVVLMLLVMASRVDVRLDRPALAL